MIVVTRLNYTRFAVNPDLIERIQATPDTTLVLVGGTTYIVTESMDEVIDMISRYRAGIISLARSMPTTEAHQHPTLGIVPFPAQDRQDRHESAEVIGLPKRGGNR